MKFTLHVSIDTNDRKIKHECCEVLAKHLAKKGVYFGVGFDPNEIDVDSFGKA